MKITDEWLKKNKTKNGGYTKLQLNLIGIPWPPIHGWKKLVIGKEISLEKKKAFEFVSRMTKSGEFNV